MNIHKIISYEKFGIMPVFILLGALLIQIPIYLIRNSAHAENHENPLKICPLKESPAEIEYQVQAKFTIKVSVSALSEPERREAIAAAVRKALEENLKNLKEDDCVENKERKKTDGDVLH